MRYRIINWSEYQHYRDRCPPWVRLHWSLLTSTVWVGASNCERVLAVVCMLLASRDKAKNGEFDGDPAYVRRVAYLDKNPDFSPLIRAGFIVALADASKTEQPQADATTETETEQRQTPPPPAGGGWSRWTPEQFALEAERANANRDESKRLTAEELADFCRYWLAPTKSGKPLFTTAMTFDLPGRLATCWRVVVVPARDRGRDGRQGRLAIGQITHEDSPLPTFSAPTPVEE